MDVVDNFVDSKIKNVQHCIIPSYVSCLENKFHMELSINNVELMRVCVQYNLTCAVSLVDTYLFILKPIFSSSFKYVHLEDDLFSDMIRLKLCTETIRNAVDYRCYCNCNMWNCCVLCRRK